MFLQICFWFDGFMGLACLAFLFLIIYSAHYENKCLFNILWCVVWLLDWLLDGLSCYQANFTSSMRKQISKNLKLLKLILY